MAYALKKIYAATIALLMMLVGQNQTVRADIPTNELEYCNDSSFSCCEPVCSPQSCGTWFGGASLLYLRAFEEGLICDCNPQQITDFVESDGHTISELKSGNDKLHFNWDLGFRIGAGYQFANSQWAIGAYWTHFREHARGCRGEDNFTRWNLKFDEVDLVAGYECKLCPCLSWTPFLGLRGAWIDQRLRSRFSTNILADSSSNFIGSQRHEKEDFWGLGPVLGMEVEWEVGCGFSFYGIIDASVLYGHFDTDFDEVKALTDVTTFCDSGRRRSAALLSGDAGLGIRWSQCFCNNMLLILEVGWEHHHYFDYNQIGSGGDMSLDGVTFSAGIAF